MYESVAASAPETAGSVGRRAWLVPAVALGISVAVGLALVFAAVLSVAPADRVLTAVWISVAVVAACTAVSTAVHFRELLTAEQRRGAALASRLAEAQAWAAAADRAVAIEQESAAAGARRYSAAIAALAAAGGRMQAMTTGMLADLQDLEHHYAEQTVLGDLLKLDHATAQAGRLADSIAILGGARTGRRWAEPIVLERVLRAAIGRIGSYQRVRMRSIAEVAIAGHAAEGVIHALSELTDNACRFSPPTTEVHIYATEIPSGVAVTIEDSGSVMSESALRYAQLAVAGTAETDTAEPPAFDGTRIGLVVVGRLARTYGLTVSYRPSAIGGTAAVVMVPGDLVVRVEAPVPAGRPTDTRDPHTVPGAPLDDALTDTGSCFPTQPVPSAGSGAGSDTAGSKYRSGRHDLPGHSSGRFPVAGADDDATTTMALPKRRPGSALAAAHPEELPAPAPPDGTTAPADPKPANRAPGSALGAFQRAVNDRVRDPQFSGEPTSSPGNGAARGARHATTTD